MIVLEVLHGLSVFACFAFDLRRAPFWFAALQAFFFLGSGLALLALSFVFLNKCRTQCQVAWWLLFVTFVLAPLFPRL